MSNSKISKKNNFLNLLLRPQFLVFFLSIIFSQVATNMLNIVLIVHTYHISKSNFAVSILVLIFLLPQVFFSFLGGIVADAKNKRKILLFGNLARALVLVAFFFVKDNLAITYTFMLIISIVTQFYIPAEAPLIPHLVKKSQLLTANALFGISLFGSILVGYVTAGPAMRIFGSNGVFLFMAFLFAMSYIFILFMPDVAPSVKKLRTKKTFIGNIFHLYNLVVKEFLEVVKILKEKKSVASSFIFLAMSQVIVLVLATIIPDYAQKTLNIPSEDISLIIFAPVALGMLVSSFAIGSKYIKIKHEKIIDAGIFLSSIVLLLFGTIDQQHYINLVFLSLIITFLAGIANACIFIPAQTIVQTHVSHKSLSKVFGLLFLVVGVIAFVPIILAGVFADFLGVRVVLLGISFALFMLGLLKLFLFKDQVSI